MEGNGVPSSYKWNKSNYTSQHTKSHFHWCRTHFVLWHNKLNQCPTISMLVNSELALASDGIKHDCCTSSLSDPVLWYIANRIDFYCKCLLNLDLLDFWRCKNYNSRIFETVRWANSFLKCCPKWIETRCGK